MTPSEWHTRLFSIPRLSTRPLRMRFDGALSMFGMVLAGVACGGDEDEPVAAVGTLGGQPAMMQAQGGSSGTPMGNPGGTSGEGVPDDVDLQPPDDGQTTTPPTNIGTPVQPVLCDPIANPGDVADGDLNVDLDTAFQTISGFGGISHVGFFFGVNPVTSQIVDLAFGTGPGQLGLTILRLPISDNPAQFPDELPTAQRAAELGARIFASPWSPPAALKTNGNVVGGELAPENYGAYADHLLSYREFMAENGVPIEAISVQNEPDIDFFRPEGPITYPGCQWMPDQIANFLLEQGARFGDTKLMAPESFNFNRDWSDPLLNDPAVAAEFEIVGGHIYGNGLRDYPLARERGKEVWMTEHYTDSGSEPDRANFWPLAYDVAKELHASMEANFNAYVWWVIRRQYGFVFDSGVATKRGYIMSQFSRFVRPGFVRVAASTPAAEGVVATAYKNGPGSVVVVVLNQSQLEQTVDLDVFGSCVTGFDRVTTSESRNAEQDEPVSLREGRVGLTLGPLSVTTLVSRPIASGSPPQ
jgi:glucuronoarabinoxylan endo-1,4-beta-xylanase